MASIDRWTFRRQFLAGPRGASLRSSWSISEATRSAAVAAHPDLTLARSSHGATSVLCLGHVVDVDRPSRTNQEIVDQLAAGIESFVDFEVATRALGGRWIMFAQVAGAERMYLDAAGTRSAFYFADGRSVWVASQPALIAEQLGLPRSTGLEQQFLRHPHGNSWPGETTPYDGVRQLLPNHYLDLSTGEPHRFWPKEPAPQATIHQAVDTIGRMLSAVVEALSSRGRLVVPLTGGYDSRALLAAAGDRRTELECVFVSDPNTPFHDLLLPRRVARACDLQLKMLRAQPMPAWLRSAYRRNAADMFWDPGEIKFATFASHFADAFFLTGGVAEIGRCFYYPDGHHPSAVTPEMLAELGGYAGNGIAVRSFARWLDEIGDTRSIGVLDLFYWEHRVGNWGAAVNGALDTFCEAIPAYNSRRYIDTVLGLDVEYRRSPYRLFRMICDAVGPRFSAIPFNESALDTAWDRVRNLIPWRIRNYILQSRLRRAGLFDPLQ